jgi:pimeloyl-ACP methyl ester carboxylesterase
MRRHAPAAGQLMATCDVASRLGDIEVPTLILTGRHDFFCPVSQGEKFREVLRGWLDRRGSRVPWAWRLRSSEGHAPTRF